MLKKRLEKFPPLKGAGSVFLQTNQFGGDVGYLGFAGGSFHESQDVGHDLVGVPAVGAHACHAQLGQLPVVAVSDLRGGDLELVAHPLQKTADDLPLGLERTGIRQMKGYAYSSNHHRRAIQAIL
jgi:hypothetical protein